MPRQDQILVGITEQVTVFFGIFLHERRCEFGVFSDIDLAAFSHSHQIKIQAIFDESSYICDISSCSVLKNKEEIFVKKSYRK